MNKIYVFEAEINKFQSKELVKRVHVLGYNLFDANHTLMHWAFDGDGRFDVEVEIGSIKKIKEIDNIINGDFIEMDMEEDFDEYDPEIPYKVVENLPDDSEAVMKFKCSCHEEIRVSSGHWLYIQCKNCENKIYRREIQDVGGIHIYVPMNK